MSQSGSGMSKDLAKYKSTFIKKIDKEAAGSSAHVTQHMIRNEGIKILDLHHALVRAREQEDSEEEINIQKQLGAFQCVYSA